MTPPHVLVVEDDETLSQLFGMVLDMLPMTHLRCGSAEDALLALQARAADVIVCDLMLPGMDGRGLLRQLQGNPAERAGARIVVMSGSIDAAISRELTELGAWRVLAKPVTVKAFMGCMEEAAQAAPYEPRGAGHADRTARIIQEHFAGNDALFLAFRSTVVAQLPHDITQGEDALARGDAGKLRHVAHNLKSVMKTLGEEAASQAARELEAAAELCVPQAQLGVAWARLRTHLQDALAHAAG